MDQSGATASRARGHNPSSRRTLVQDAGFFHSATVTLARRNSGQKFIPCCYAHPHLDLHPQRFGGEQIS